jgi:PHD/YefM family antitoxin component YafN of YafNO toxin-antitoxin module
MYIYNQVLLFGIMGILNYTEFRSNLKHWLDNFFNDGSELIIKRKGLKDLVLDSSYEYNSKNHQNLSSTVVLEDFKPYICCNEKNI